MNEKTLEIWHIYSDGTKSDIPFGTEEEKCFVWNSIALCAWQSEIVLLVVDINDTHFHLLAKGNPADITFFQNRIRQRLHRHFRMQGKREKIYLSCDRIQTRTEILSKFMYVYRNCMDFYKKLPGEYPWGCGNLYFSEKRFFHKGKRIMDLSFREYRYYFKTHKQLPKDWLCDPTGRILPECFIDYEYVENLFGSARAFIAFLYVRKEDEIAQKQNINRVYMENRSIQDLRRIANELSSSINGRMLEKSSLSQRLAIATYMIRQGLSGKSASLAKALYLKQEDLHHLI